MEIKNQKIGVIGLGPKTGVSLVKYLHEQGAKIYVYDDQPKDKLGESLKALEGIPVHAEFGLPAPENLSECSTWIVSPGVPCYKPYLIDARRRGIDTISELDFAARFIQAPILAVTGSNGKSTTTALLGHILEGWKKNVFVGGNIGIPLIQAAGKSYDFVVVEVSSFQLELTEKFHPKAACVLNVTPNHMDRHGNMTTYKSMKEKLLQNMDKDNKAVLNDDDENCRFIAAKSNATNWMFSWKNRKHAPIHVEGEEIVFWDGRKVSIKGFGLPGNHNLENAVAAVSLAVAVDCPKEVIEKQLKTFQGLPYRLQNIGSLEGAAYINDAKSTTPNAAMQALAALPKPVIFIAGGRSKNASYKDLALAAQKKVRKNIFYGECAESMRAAFSGQDVQTVGTLDEAFEIAAKEAAQGDHVLFSPANSSFDQYPGFEKRGEHFTALYKKRLKKA